MKKCPYCAEEIQNDAIKCRYCNEFLADKEIELREKNKIEEKKEEGSWFWLIILIIFFAIGAYNIFSEVTEETKNKKNTHLNKSYCMKSDGYQYVSMVGCGEDKKISKQAYDAKNKKKKETKLNTKKKETKLNTWTNNNNNNSIDIEKQKLEEMKKQTEIEEKKRKEIEKQTELAKKNLEEQKKQSEELAEQNRREQLKGAGRLMMWGGKLLGGF